MITTLEDFTPEQVKALQAIANRFIDLEAAVWVLRWGWQVIRWGGWIGLLVVVVAQTGSIWAAIKYLVTTGHP